MPEKPTGGKAFDDLASKLVKVPKAELDRQVQRWKARKRKKKK